MSLPEPGKYEILYVSREMILMCKGDKCYQVVPYVVTEGSYEDVARIAETTTAELQFNEMSREDAAGLAMNKDALDELRELLGDAL